MSTIGDVMSLVMRSSFLAPLRISDSLQTRCGDATECDLNKKLASSTRDHEIMHPFWGDQTSSKCVVICNKILRCYLFGVI